MEGADSGGFPATQWSVVLAASRGDAFGEAALETLCRAYWPPLYAYLRRDGHPVEEAKDLVQGFLVRLLARGDLRAVAPENGRFRAYLLAGLRHFLVSEVRRGAALKRGGGVSFVSLEGDDEVLAGPEWWDASNPPEAAFDRCWAETVLAQALQALRREYGQRGKADQFEALRETLTGDPDGGYADLGRRLGLSEGAVAVAVHRLRSRLREVVRGLVAETVASPTELEDELRHLRALWSR